MPGCGTSNTYMYLKHTDMHGKAAVISLCSLTDLTQSHFSSVTETENHHNLVFLRDNLL